MAREGVGTGKLPWVLLVTFWFTQIRFARINFEIYKPLIHLLYALPKHWTLAGTPFIQKHRTRSIHLCTETRHRLDWRSTYRLPVSGGRDVWGYRRICIKKRCFTK
ncbi:hypothetical protein M427DRAFT_353383 [Gonapodya prolifera JEL478]|uniref:Uncharacterized protein n=1 Tax=Gonapodya prolifera (strain JEL478) TaxID=1344416 RepID=A0A139AC11_GONPJ|nr:hypothetical protein M427DRAFT_353383 [Gonapodya prolifera JEL478]|eukprot:KXS14310.1 hypothetical protein M427DRAFT_353383 [Gonapodya prolifera JEL478]